MVDLVGLEPTTFPVRGGCAPCCATSPDGGGGRTRTDDLQVMGLVSCRCSTPRQKHSVQAASTRCPTAEAPAPGGADRWRARMLVWWRLFPFRTALRSLTTRRCHLILAAEWMPDLLVGQDGLEPSIATVSEWCVHHYATSRGGRTGNRTLICRVQTGGSPFELLARMVTGRVQVARAVVVLYHLSYWPAWWASEDSNLEPCLYQKHVRPCCQGTLPANWWSWSDLNRRPSRCHRAALPLRYSPRHWYTREDSHL